MARSSSNSRVAGLTSGFFKGFQGAFVKFGGVREIVFFAVKIAVSFENFAAQRFQIIKLAEFERAFEMFFGFVEFAAIKMQTRDI